MQNALHEHAEDEEWESGVSIPQRTLRSLIGGLCGHCQSVYSAREAVLSIFLGLKNSPRCMRCVSQALKRDEEQLWVDFHHALVGRNCYLLAWHEAEQMDGVSKTQRGNLPEPSAPQIPASMQKSDAVKHEWNAGDIGCGELVMALRQRLLALPPGSVIQVTATDPAAPEDLPAWCRLCGHTLISFNHPLYWIRRKGE